MGCGGSKKVGIDALDFVRERYPRTLAFLEMQKYSRELANLFAKNDRNNDQNLAISEFLKALKVQKNRISIRLFSICDMDGSGTLDFRELMFTLWHLCTVDEKGLVHIVFDLYDEDQDGSIDFDDLFRLLVDCYGKEHMENENIQRIMQKAQDNGPMNRQQFMAFTARSPQTLKQIIDMQQRVREETLGHKAWTQLEKKRQLKTDALFRPERWSDLYAKILVLDIQARSQKARNDATNDTAGGATNGARTKGPGGGGPTGMAMRDVDSEAAGAEGYENEEDKQAAAEAEAKRARKAKKKKEKEEAERKKKEAEDAKNDKSKIRNRPLSQKAGDGKADKRGPSELRNGKGRTDAIIH